MSKSNKELKVLVIEKDTECVASAGLSIIKVDYGEVEDEEGELFELVKKIGLIENVLVDIKYNATGAKNAKKDQTELIKHLIKALEQMAWENDCSDLRIESMDVPKQVLDHYQFWKVERNERVFYSKRKEMWELNKMNNPNDNSMMSG